MIELPISEYAKTWLAEQGIVLTDFQRASLYWNSNLLEEEKLSALKELRENTADGVLREQISVRLAHQEKKWSTFFQNDGSWVYSVLFEEEEQPNGRFLSAETALRYVIEYTRRVYERPMAFWLEKYLLVRGDTIPEQPNPIHIDPNLPGADQWKEPQSIPYEGDPVAGILYTEEGRVKHLWSNEVPEFPGEWDKDRFENKFIPWPNPFQRGDMVRMAGDDCLGVVETSQADWADFLARVEKNLYAESWDAAVTVDLLAPASGEIGHAHICPLLLEPVTDWPDEGEFHVMQALSHVLTNRYPMGLGQFIMAYEYNVRRRSLEKEAQ